jgi:hypothetical protein
VLVRGVPGSAFAHRPCGFRVREHGRLDGQRAIREFSGRTAASALRIDDLETVAVHRTSDPEVVIVARCP